MANGPNKWHWPPSSGVLSCGKVELPGVEPLNRVKVVNARDAEDATAMTAVVVEVDMSVSMMVDLLL